MKQKGLARSLGGGGQERAGRNHKEAESLPSQEMWGAEEGVPQGKH